MVIGFTGKMRSGKSTACAYVMEHYGPAVKHINFKDALITELKKNFTPLLEEIVTYYVQHEHEAYTVDELFFVKPPLVRKLMQCYGTEVRRGDDFLYWIKKWKGTVTYTKEDVVCDDVRFLNEAAAVKDMGGFVIRIIREDITNTGTHQSESEMDQIEPDFSVTAKKDDLEDLYKQIDEIIAKIGDNSLVPIVN